MSAPATVRLPRARSEPAFELTMSDRICPDCRARYLPLRGRCLCKVDGFAAPTARPRLKPVRDE